MAETGGQQCILFAMMGFFGFLCGRYWQQESATRQLYDMIRSDPYVFNQRHKLYPLVSAIPTDHEARLWRRNMTIIDRLRNCLTFSVYDSVISILFNRNPAIYAPDLLDLMKYGLPSSENLVMHKDYIVSHDLSITSPKWICEHLRGNYKKLDTAGDSDELHLRYNDVFVLSCGAKRLQKAFQRDIWRQLEIYVSKLTEKFGSVYVYTGPMYLPTFRSKVKGYLKYQVVDNWIPVPVPSHYFKVIIVDSQLPNCAPYMEGYFIENRLSTQCRCNELAEYLIDIGEIERHTGLHFYEGVQGNVRFSKDIYKIDEAIRFQYLQESGDDGQLSVVG